MKNLTAVRLCVVSRSPVVEVIIKRPERKYQLGFSVQNGVICSLLRGGIAERGGIRVGHRIIEINGTSVVAVSHDKIVHMLSTSVGEVSYMRLLLSVLGHSFSLHHPESPYNAEIVLSPSINEFG